MMADLQWQTSDCPKHPDTPYLLRVAGPGEGQARPIIAEWNSVDGFWSEWLDGEDYGTSFDGQVTGWIELNLG
jgi:hypothetical protein